MPRQMSKQNVEAMKMLAAGRSCAEVARVQGRAVKAVAELRRRRPSLPQPKPAPAPVQRTKIIIAGDTAVVNEGGFVPPYQMRAIDVTHCEHCGLRGHVAGDPERCLRHNGGYGLGGQMSATHVWRRSRA